MTLTGYKKRLDNPEEVSKRCSNRIADSTMEKVAKNLKENKIKY